MRYNEITLPDGLDERAYRFIRSILNRLKEEGKLHRYDEFTLFMLADDIDNFLKYSAAIKGEGDLEVSDRGNSAISPYGLLYDKCYKRIASMLKEMGLTLGSRAKMKIADTGEESSPLTEFFKNNDE